jgi:hypothetical protein
MGEDERAHLGPEYPLLSMLPKHRHRRSEDEDSNENYVHPFENDFVADISAACVGEQCKNHNTHQ